MDAEWPKAKEVYAEASLRYSDVMEAARNSGRLDFQVLDSVVSPMVESVLRNRDALAWLAMIKRADDYTYGHSISCAIYSIAFGRHLGLPKEDINILGLGALLLDIGKTRIPKELLGKKEELTPEELSLMHHHVEYGLEMLDAQEAVLDPRIVQMVRSHHERHDGSGYPRGQSGLGIPVFARIAGIVDYFDAVVSERPYAQPVSAYDAVRSLNKFAGSEFQPEVVEQFVQAIGMFPNGTLVELSTGEVAVVIEQNRVRRLRPKVLILLDAEKTPLAESRSLDLRDLPADQKEPGAVWLERGLESGAYGIDAAEYFL